MEDEYGDMSSSGETFTFPGTFTLEDGSTLESPSLCYNTYGTLNESRDNVLLVTHALTGNSDLASWWGNMLGPGKTFDTDKYFIVCANILGSCYGSTSPASIDPATSLPYGGSFPDVSVRDTIALQFALLSDLNVSSIKSVIGGSFGGMQVLEAMFASTRELSVRSAVPIACGSSHTAWQIAISEVQRQAIYADPSWNGGDCLDVRDSKGLNVARQMGMVTYRTARAYDLKFGREKVGEGPAYGKDAKWQVKSYLEYQGDKFLSRFDPITYVKLTEQMDTHDVGRGRGGIAKALLSLEMPSLVIGIDSDVLYPLHEQESLFSALGSVEKKFVSVRSEAGHDGFLLEQETVGKAIDEFLERIE
ncbi:hypothetical protein TeGR_g14035 [Tetraparma gracilis]|uniref:AB hydrolase-1 domain-containing protein n=1 Tax=Tetraparma gracilis TaxID=2962635 RepID=A0ABQ6MSR7_9STRA|nr:hypothetical protein TeGR_g14035 [Tetraparma gracilis]